MAEHWVCCSAVTKETHSVEYSVLRLAARLVWQTAGKKACLRAAQMVDSRAGLKAALTASLMAASLVGRLVAKKAWYSADDLGQRLAGKMETKMAEHWVVNWAHQQADHLALSLAAWKETSLVVGRAQRWAVTMVSRKAVR